MKTVEGKLNGCTCKWWLLESEKIKVAKETMSEDEKKHFTIVALDNDDDCDSVDELKKEIASSKRDKQTSYGDVFENLDGVTGILEYIISQDF